MPELCTSENVLHQDLRKQKEATHAQINQQMEGRMKETKRKKKAKEGRTKKLIKPRNKIGEYHYIKFMDSV